MFFGWPCSNIIVEISIHNKHGCTERGLFALYEHEKIPKNSCFQTLIAWKKIGYGLLKNSGERSRAILALLFYQTV